MNGQDILSYILARAREASTWRGIILLLTAVGVQLSEDQQLAICTAGLAAAGVVGAFFPDKPKGPNE